MIETTERLLALLSALQSRPHWSGPELAAHLDVTVRTVRRDIDRLRLLGYAIESDTGVAGGYRLGVGGSAAPPLMLDADEAVAIAVSLRASAHAGNPDDALARVLTKLEQITPSRVRPQVEAIETATVALPTVVGAFDPDVFVAVSRACRFGDVVVVDYTDRQGRTTERTIEPFRAVHSGRNWYVVARDRDAARSPDDDGWRTLRLDRIANLSETGHRADLTDAPDPVEFVQRGITTAAYTHQARIELAAPIELLAQQIPANVGILEALDERTTMFTTGSDDLDLIVVHLARLDVPFRVVEPDSLRERLLVLADRLRTAAHNADSPVTN